MLFPNFTRTLLILCATSFLSACDNDKSNNTSKNEIAESMEDAEIVLASAGIGPINGATPFNIHQITIAFQPHDYHVEQIKTSTHGEDYPVIRISKDTDPLLLINPTVDQEKIFSVVVMDKRIGNSLGHKLGSEFGSIYSFGNVEQCTAGAESLSGKVLCYAPKSGNILYMFDDEEENSFPDNKLPPADALDGWKLKAIIWKPKR